MQSARNLIALRCAKRAPMDALDDLRCCISGGIRLLSDLGNNVIFRFEQAFVLLILAKRIHDCLNVF